MKNRRVTGIAVTVLTAGLALAMSQSETFAGTESESALNVTMETDQQKSGWVNANGKWFYYNPTTGEKTVGWKKISGKKTASWYYFNQNGVMQIGWKLIGGNYYHFDSEGRMETGWTEVSGKWYFLKAGVMYTGWLKQGGEYYYFSPKTGAAVTGCVKIDGKWYYFGTGSMTMQTGWLWVDGERYYFKPGVGFMATGWTRIDQKWYYFRENGRKTIGWKLISGKWYYFGDDGEMKTGNVSIDGSWYCFSVETGAMIKGWANIYNTWSYCDPTTGKCVTGLQKIGGKWYYFDSTYGIMLTDHTYGSFVQDWTGDQVGGIKVGKDGVVEYIECATQSRNRYKVRLYANGKFEGTWETYDHNTSGTIYEWDTEVKFHGTFSNFTRVTDTKLYATLKSITFDSAVTVTRDQNTQRQISVDHDVPYHLESEYKVGDTFYLYLPGTSQYSILDGFDEFDSEVCIFDLYGNLKNCVLDNPGYEYFFNAPAGWR